MHRGQNPASIKTTRPTVTDIKTHIRLRTTAFAAVDYLVNVLILFAYAVAGTISIEVPLKILAVATVFNMIFLGGIATGITQDFRDPSVTGYQILAACGINLLATLLAPQIAYMFMVNLFVPLAYGVLHFDRRGFFLSWVLLSVAVSAVLWSLGSQAGIALSSDIERVLFPVVVVLALGRFVAINAEVSRLRARLLEKNKELASAPPGLPKWRHMTI
jgi:diguanylate cyclase